MTYDSSRHHRHSLRLDGYRYDIPGAYCVTICTHQRERLLGKIVGCDVELNENGCRVEAEWLALADRFPGVALDQYVIMPNHVHAIVFLDAHEDAEGANEAAQKVAIPALGTVVGVCKSVSTIAINRATGRAGHTLWQRNYYDQIIRNEQMLSGLRRYILDNPARWQDDPENTVLSP